MQPGTGPDPTAPPQAAPAASAALAGIEEWLRRHLPGLLGRVELGIFCAGQGLRLSELSSPLQPLPEAVERLSVHLRDVGRLRSFAVALLEDEATAASAREQGLLGVLGEDAAPPGPRPPRLCHHLLRAPAFVGRSEELSTLDWAWQEGARVMALSGPPGAGKTAILQHWLDGRGLSDPRRWHDFGVEGLFIWSFHADPDVSSFLRSAADYVEGRAPLQAGPQPEDVGARSDLRRLLQALERQKGHVLLVIDGLERFQAAEPQGPLPPDLQALQSQEPLGYRPGEIVDPSLRAFLIEMAAVDGEAALLCTLERDVPSLLPWRGSGYVAVRVPPLALPDGALLLRELGVVRGGESDAERRCVEHGGHALTLDLLGRYLSTYYRGDARAVTVSELPPNDTARLSDSPTLRRVLKAHTQALTEPLRGLLEICALLPGPAPLASLLALAQVAGEHMQGGQGGQGEPAAQARAPLAVEALLQPLRGLDGPALQSRLQELGRLGLVHLYGGVEGGGVDLHPLVRQQLYRAWVDARSGRATPSAHSAPEIGEPLPQARDGAVLDLLEQLVLVLLEAGLLTEAYELLSVRMGGYPHMGRALGEYRRLLAVLRILVPVLCTVSEGDATWARRCARVAAWEAEVLRDLGLLSEALDVARRGLGQRGEPIPGSQSWIIDSHLSAGRLRQAQAIARDALFASRSVAGRVLSSLQQARALLLLGEVSLSRVYLMEAQLTLKEDPGAICERSGVGLRELVDRERVQMLLRLSDVGMARPIVQRCQASALRDGRGKDLAEIDILLGEIARRERDPLDASQSVHRALAWGSKTGDVDILVRAGLCHARIRMDSGNLDGAASAIGMALPTAMEHGLGVDRVDLLIVRGLLLLRRGDVQQAEADARDALAYATAPGCGYLWGEADALHLLAMTLLAGRPPGARILEAATHLSDEIDLRERMLDPRAQDVRWLLKRLTG